MSVRTPGAAAALVHGLDVGGFQSSSELVPHSETRGLNTVQVALLTFRPAQQEIIDE